MANVIKPLDMAPLFPHDVLKKPVRERVEFFRTKVIGHPYIRPLAKVGFVEDLDR
jgi:hypothetical protein